MTIQESLQQINLYPIPDNVVVNYCNEHGVTPSDEATSEIRKSRDYRLTKADLYKWLAFAPSTVSQGGVTFSISESDKKRFVDLANKIYAENDEQGYGTIYGYKGSRL